MGRRAPCLYFYPLSLSLYPFFKMANAEWLAIYRTYTPDELTAEVARLKQQNTEFSQQQVGGKGYTKDLAELRGKFSAAVRVQQERGLIPGQTGGFMVTDFSGVGSLQWK